MNLNCKKNTTQEVLYYYNCLIAAKNLEISLFEFYKKTMNYKLFSSLLDNLYKEEKIDQRLLKKFIKEINLNSEDFLEKFKNISKLSKDDICFFINHYLYNLFEKNIPDYTFLKKIYGPLTIDNLKLIEKEFPNKIIFYETYEGEKLFKTIDDEAFELKWYNMFITFENKEEKEEIQELIYALEEINKDNININITKRLKELLKIQLNIDF